MAERYLHAALCVRSNRPRPVQLQELNPLVGQDVGRVLDCLRPPGARGWDAAQRAAALLDQSSGASHLEGTLDLVVERVPVVAHDLARLRDVPQLVSELK